VLGKIELYAGYDHAAIWGGGGATRLSGPLAGPRAWF
jgi:hypothetical protein